MNEDNKVILTKEEIELLTVLEELKGDGGDGGL